MAVTYAKVREWVLALPGTQEVFVERWGDWTLRCGSKIFVIGAPGAGSMSVKASLQDQAELVGSDPETYAWAAYTGRYGWVRVDLSRARSDELRRIVEEGWRRTAPKRLAREYDSSRPGKS
jgi:hypothetical protein